MDNVCLQKRTHTHTFARSHGIARIRCLAAANQFELYPFAKIFAKEINSKLLYCDRFASIERIEKRIKHANNTFRSENCFDPNWFFGL